MKGNWRRFLITWIVLFLIIEFIMGAFGLGKKDNEQQVITDGVVIEAIKDEMTIGKEMMVNIENLKGEPITITEANCMPAFNVMFYNAGVWEEVAVQEDPNCTQTTPLTLESGEKGKYSFLRWNYKLFGELGRYKITLNLDREYTSPEFIIKERGLFKRAWHFFFYKPIYNSLVFLTDINPSHSLGVAIILLTLVIRLILLVPSGRALRAQKRMQEIQPKIQEIQKKYKGNQERIAMETMALWKSAKVNPLGSCLPMLIQFPILIGLYFAVREVAFGGNSFMLYGNLQDFDFDSIHTVFLGVLELADRNKIALPLVVGFLQFIQMKLTFSLRGMKKQPKKEKKPDGMPDMQAMNKSMTYVMPLMIAFFTATLPAGVGLYWGTSTIFGIGQTYMINREKPGKEKEGMNVSVKNSDEVTVKVVEKTPEEKHKEEKEKYLPKGKKKKKKH